MIKVKQQLIMCVGTRVDVKSNTSNRHNLASTSIRTEQLLMKQFYRKDLTYICMLNIFLNVFTCEIDEISYVDRIVFYNVSLTRGIFFLSSKFSGISVTCGRRWANRIRTSNCENAFVPSVGKLRVLALVQCAR